MRSIQIIGASDAGISAALRIREIDPKAEVTVMAADAYPNFSICGLPFYLSGEVADWRSLAHRSREEIEENGISLLLNHRALAIDSKTRQVRVRSEGEKTREIGYDKLLIATGAESVKPPIEGVNTDGVFFLRWMADSFAVKRFMEQQNPRRAVIIGGGYIGLEMADALTRKGLSVTLMEAAPEILTTSNSMKKPLKRKARKTVVNPVLPCVKKCTENTKKTTNLTRPWGRYAVYLTSAQLKN